MLTDKLKKEGKYDIDPVTKQTINSPRKFASKMNASFEEKRLAGHEEEVRAGRGWLVIGWGREGGGGGGGSGFRV